MIFVEISPDLGMSLPASLLEQAARETLAEQGAGEADLSLVLTGDSELAALNREFLGKDGPTDVLSFPSDEQDPETGRDYRGDVIISLPRAREQAADHGHPLEAEVQLLVVHGVLHLLGHDHEHPAEKDHMWSVQEAVLGRLGLDPSIVHE